MSENLEHLGFNRPVIAEDNRTLLEEFGPRAVNDYRDNKRSLLIWLLTKGRNPFEENGYAVKTVKKTHYKVERIFRWVWKDRKRYCWRFEPDTANAFLDYLVKFDDIPQPQVVEYEKGMKLLFKYWTDTTDANIDWSYDRSLKSSYDSERDHFRPDELRALYEASLSYNTVRVTEDNRETIIEELGRRFNKKQSEVTAEDIKRANSWKVPSLISVSNDLGLRPREVELAKVSWFYPDEELVRIPADESVKSSSPWTCGLSDQSARALSKWLAERETYTTYDDTELVWLNDAGTAYDNKSVNYLLNKLMDEAGIESPRRNLTWYSIRHGVATMWANQEGAHYAQEQMRHEKAETTMNYLHSNENQQSEFADGKW
jgi:integrase